MFIHVARQPFGEVSPAAIRAGLVAEEQSGFDDAWRAVCLAAAEFLARAEERLRIGAKPTGGMSGDETRAMIAERLGLTPDQLRVLIQKWRQDAEVKAQMPRIAKYTAQMTPATAQ